MVGVNRSNLSIYPNFGLRPGVHCALNLGLQKEDEDCAAAVPLVSKEDSMGRLWLWMSCGVVWCGVARSQYPPLLAARGRDIVPSRPDGNTWISGFGGVGSQGALGT